MRILFLTPRESKTNLGGVERHVRLLTEELVKRGHQVKELSLGETDKSYKDYKNYKDQNNTPIASLDSSTRRKLLARNDAFSKFRAWRYLWDRRELFRWAEVVHVHDVFWWVMPFLPIIRINNSYKCYKNNKEKEKGEKDHPPKAEAFRRAGKDGKEKGNTGRILFTTFHGWEGRWPPTWVAVWQKKLAAFLSDGTIGVGNFFEKWYGVKTDRVVWGAIGDKLINRQIDKSTSRQTRGFRIVFFGRLEKVNGIDLVIESMKKIVAPAVRSLSSEASGLAPESVATAGFGRASGFLQGKNPGPSEEEVNGIEVVIEAAKRLNKERERGEKEQKDQRGEGNTGRILFLFVGDGSFRKQAERVGRVTGMVAEPWKILADADIVVASSYLAILEAAAMGKRIIAVANNPLKRDYLEGHPLREFFKIVGSVEELAGEIRESVSPPSLTSGLLGTIRTRPEERLVGGFGRASGFLPCKNPGPSEKVARRWAMEQTPSRLADVYEELWKSKSA